MLKWFKEKRKRKKDIMERLKQDFSKYNIIINMKVMCLFEQLANKSFLEVSGIEDIYMVMYASLVVNNKEFKNLTYKTFQILIEDDANILQWMVTEYDKIGKYTSQFNMMDMDTVDESGTTKVIKMMDVASTLITRYGMDCNYVMYDMQMWEIAHYYSIIDNKIKDDYEEKRMWTYLSMLPHVDGKKLRSPQQLIRFPWEEEQHKKDFETEAKAAVGFLGGMAMKTE